MAKKIFLRDLSGAEVLPITRGELVLDSSGNPAFHSNKFLATESQPGLMSAEDKKRIDDLENTGPGADNKVAQVNTTTSDVYRLLFSETATDETKTEGARKSAKLTFNPSTGVLQTTALIGNLDGTYVNKLTGYTKATTVAGITSEDSLSTALGKLELKADATYDLVKGAYDGDDTIENLAEILKVLDGISDTETIQAIVGKYLPLTGGTLILEDRGSFSVKRNKGAGYGAYIQYENSEEILGHLGFYKGSDNVYGIDVYFGDNSNYQLIHSGNIGNQYVKGFVEVGPNANGRYDANELTSGGIMVNGSTFAKWDNAPTGANVGSIIHFSPGGKQLYSLQMYIDGFQNKIAVRNYTANRTWNDWKTIAFTDSNITGNAGSATKLQTARTIWGQSFDGTRNITGDLIIRLDAYGGSGNIVYNNLSFLGSVDGRGGLIRCGINDVYSNFSSLEFGSYVNPTMMLINSSGNVLIGTTTDSGTKLYVSGDVRFDGQTRINGSMRFYGKTNLSSDMYIDNQSVGGLNFAWSDGNSRFFIGDNVGIGTTTPSYKLDVIGSLKSESHFISTTIKDHTNPTDQCLVINSTTTPSGVSLTLKNSPGIGFHIASLCWASLVYGYSSRFNFINSSANGYAPVAAGSFIKADSTDDYVLLGGGGHKLESDLSVSYANSAADSDKLGGRPSGQYVWNIQEADFDPSDVVGNYVGMSTKTGLTSNWTHILSFDWRSSGTSKISGGANSSWETQLALPTQNRKSIYYRSFSSTAPYDWVELIDSANILSKAIGYLHVHDVRNASRAPSYFPSYTISGWFNSTGTPSSSWYSGIHVKGWTNGYASWELCSYSSTGTTNDYDLYFRNGNSSWGSWKTILNSSNVATYALKNYGADNSRPNGSTFTLPGGANVVSTRSRATSGSDIGIFYLSDDNAFICNSSDDAYLFATFDTDKTADFSTSANAAFAVLSKHAGIQVQGAIYTMQPSADRRAGIIGTYDPNRAAAIWSMGSNYQIAADGTSFGALYGAAYAYFGSGYTFGANYSLGHSFVWCQGGTPTAALGNNIWTSGNMYAAHFYENSDENLKKNIRAILDSDNIPVIKEFDWKSDGTHSYGLIAQELEEQGYSELVSDNGSHKTVNYSAALSLIVGKLQNKIKELEAEIENLKLRA